MVYIQFRFERLITKKNPNCWKTEADEHATTQED